MKAPIRRRRSTGEANIFPANYRADTIAFLRTWLNDTSNIREASISEPALKSAGRVERYILCVRFNAKNSTGKYEGAKERMVVFLAGKLDTMVDVAPRRMRRREIPAVPRTRASRRDSSQLSDDHAHRARHGERAGKCHQDAIEDAVVVFASRPRAALRGRDLIDGLGVTSLAGRLREQDVRIVGEIDLGQFVGIDDAHIAGGEIEQAEFILADHPDASS